MARNTWTTGNLAANAGFKEQKEISSTVALRTFVNVNDPSGLRNQCFYVETITHEAYSYNGLSLAGATAAVAELITHYTKTINVPVIASGVVTYEEKSQCVASVRGVHVVGGMWNVDVDVNDTEYDLELIATV